MSYPDDLKRRSVTLMEFGCQKCGDEWEVRGTIELGAWEAVNDYDEICKECGERGRFI